MIYRDLPQDVRGVISLDFDGTIHLLGFSDKFEPKLWEVLDKLREQGWIWGVNTGRSLDHLLEGLTETSPTFLPDFVAVKEREVFRYDSTSAEWIDFYDFNKNSDLAHDTLFQRIRPLSNLVEKMVTEHTNAEWVSIPGDPAGVIATSVSEMDSILSYVDELLEEWQDVHYMHNTVYMRFAHKDYHKGECLRYVAAHYGVNADRCFAMGDGHNDVEMLDSKYALHFACPSNSPRDVQELVTQRGGYVSKYKAAEGVIDALNKLLSTPA